MNEVVKYKNELNTVSMRRWTAEEMNFFFTVIAKVRDEGTRLISFDSDDLKELSGFADEHHLRWIDTMKSVAIKALNLKYIEQTENKLMAMNLFSWFEISSANKTVEVEVSSKFEYVVNRLEANFTKFELEEFTNIRSTYSKTLYRQLKQFRATGWREFSLDEFKEVMEIPTYYKPGNIDQKVLSPCMKELSPLFPGLKLKKIHADKRGRPLIGLKFTWNPEKSNEWIEGKYQNTVTKSGQKLPNWYDKKLSTPPTEETKKQLEKRLKRIGKSEKVETDAGEFVDQVVLFDD